MRLTKGESDMIRRRDVADRWDAINHAADMRAKRAVRGTADNHHRLMMDAMTAIEHAANVRAVLRGEQI